MPAKRIGAALSALLFAGCHSGPPSFFDDACRTETRERRFETPAPAGLAVPYDVQAFETLVLTGADWVEHNVHGVGGSRANTYREGPGRYRIWLTNLSEPTCREALRRGGFDPDGRTHIGRQGAAPIYEAEAACLKAERLGDAVPEVRGVNGAAVTLEDRSRGWTAPYILTSESAIDLRSPPDAPVTRRSIKIVERETARPIIELVGFSFAPKTNWFPRITECGAPGFASVEQIPQHAFRAQQ